MQRQVANVEAPPVGQPPRCPHLVEVLRALGDVGEVMGRVFEGPRYRRLRTSATSHSYFLASLRPVT